MCPVSESSLRRAARQGTAWSAVAAWVEQLFRIAVLVVLVRLIPPASFGLFALAASFTGIVLSVSGQGLTAAIVQIPKLEGEHLDTAFWSGVLGSVAALSGTALVTTFFTGPGAKPALSTVVAVLAFKYPLAISGHVPQAILRRNLRFRELAGVQMLSQMVAGITALSMAVAGLGVWSLVGRSLMESAAATICMWAVVRWRPRPAWTRGGYRALMAMGAGITAVQLLRVAKERVAEIIIGFGGGTEALGYFSVARRLLDSVGALFRRPVGNVAWAMLARVQDDMPRLRRTLLERLDLLYLVTLPTLAAMMVLAVPLVEVIAGRAWRPMAPLVVALAVAAAWEILEGLTLSAITARGLIGLRIVLEGVVMAVALACLLVLLPWGVVPMAWGYAAGIAVGTVVTQIVAVSRLPVGFRELVGAILPGALAALGAAVVMAAALHLCPPGSPPLARLVAAGIPGGAVTLGAWWWRLKVRGGRSAERWG